MLSNAFLWAGWSRDHIVAADSMDDTTAHAAAPPAAFAEALAAALPAAFAAALAAARATASCHHWKTATSGSVPSASKASRSR